MSANRKSPLVLALTFAIAAFLGWLIGRDATNPNKNSGETEKNATKPQASVPYDPPNPPSMRPRDRRVAREANEAGAIPNERLVAFATEEAYQKFLLSLDGSGLRLLGKIDRYRTVRLGFDDLNDLRDSLDDENAKESANYLVFLPDVPAEEDIPISGTGFGSNMLAWLGINEDNSQFGTGQLVAVVDTGFTNHAALEGFRQIDLVGGDIAFHSHGNSMGSIIAGQDENYTGLAPNADLLSVRIANEDGSSNSFLLAEGILAAADAGADIINISMGSESDSQIVQNAVRDAIASGALIVASAGNNGQAYLSFPAGNEGVISVGSVEAGGSQLAFSHTSESLDLVAPGLEILAADLEGYSLISGTSPSAGVVSGSIAAVSDQLNLSPADAWEVIQNNLNEAGAPGPDPYYGEGILNMERALNSNTPGIYDMALTTPYYEPGAGQNGNAYLHFTAENQGTESVSSELYIITSNGETPINLGSLAPNEIATYSLPVNNTAETLSVNARVQIPGNLTDVKQQNNEVVGTLSRSLESE